MTADPIPEPIRLTLGATASAALTSTGESCFAVVERGHHSDRPGAWVLHLLPCSIATGNDAVRVARGLATVRKIRSRS